MNPESPAMNPETLRARGGDHREEIFGILAYWQESNDLCRCDAPFPIGACLRCDMERLENMISEPMLANDSDSIAGSCNCLTMSPDIRYHKRGCKYRLISERDEARAAVKLMRDTFARCSSPAQGGSDPFTWIYQDVFAAADKVLAATRTPVPESGDADVGIHESAMLEAFGPHGQG